MTAELPEMKTRTLANWFGSARTNAQRIGAELGKLRWCGVPFCGGCPELPYIDTCAGVAVDRHRHIINMAKVICDPAALESMLQIIGDTLFHPDELKAAQVRCSERECGDGLFTVGGYPAMPDVQWAADYFIATWMARGGTSGKSTEFTQGLAIRYGAGGGDSAVRFRSAADSLTAWQTALLRWSFDVEDAFRFLDRVKDEKGHGLYIDAPWPDAGREYKHRFDDDRQCYLAGRLAGFKNARIVIRFGDHPLIRELYPESRWNWIRLDSRNQRGNTVSEVLLMNGVAFAD